MYISIWLLSNILIINLLCILSYLVILPIEKICKQFYCGYKITSRVLLLLQYVFLVFGFVRTYICVYNYFLFEFWFWGSFPVFFFQLNFRYKQTCMLYVELLHQFIHFD